MVCGTAVDAAIGVQPALSSAATGNRTKAARIFIRKVENDRDWRMGQAFRNGKGGSKIAIIPL